MPSDFAKEDGSPYQSGTEWEFEDALKEAERGDQPTILLYRRDEEPTIGARDSELREKLDQLAKIDAFFDNLKGEAGSLWRTVAGYGKPEDFRRLLLQHLEHVVCGFVGQGYSEELGVANMFAILEERNVPREHLQEKLERMRLNYRKAAEHFAEAASLVPLGRDDSRLDLLMEEASARKAKSLTRTRHWSNRSGFTDEFLLIFHGYTGHRHLGLLCCGYGRARFSQHRPFGAGGIPATGAVFD